MMSSSEIIRFFDMEIEDIRSEESLINTVEETVEVGYSPTEHRLRNLKIRLALHLAPKSIFFPDKLDDPIYIVAMNHINTQFGFEEQKSREIGQEIQRIFEYWEENRSKVIRYKDRLLRRQGNLCANCHIDFDKKILTLKHKDVLKPYHHRSEDNKLTEPVVDHINPIWALGSNNLDNLQVLCKLCNQGKGGSVEKSIRSEIENAKTPPSKVPWKQRAEMFYQATKNTEECPICGSETEITVDFSNKFGCYVKSNLQPMCVDCKFYTE